MVVSQNRDGAKLYIPYVNYLYNLPAKIECRRLAYFDPKKYTLKPKLAIFSILY